MGRKLSEETWEILDRIIHELMVAPEHRAAEEAVLAVLKEEYGIDWNEIENERDRIDAEAEPDEEETEEYVADVLLPDDKRYGPEN